MLCYALLRSKHRMIGTSDAGPMLVYMFRTIATPEPKAEGQALKRECGCDRVSATS